MDKTIEKEFSIGDLLNLVIIRNEEDSLNPVIEMKFSSIIPTNHLIIMSFYDEEKNQMNIEKHGISFRNAARVFFDYDRIEMYDDEHSEDEDRYNTIGDTAYGNLSIIGNLNRNGKTVDDILFVVYTERTLYQEGEKELEVTRLISARLATNFERGLYYGKYS